MKKTIPLFLQGSALTVAALCVGTSIYQAAGFLAGLATNEIERAGLVAATFGIIAGSSVLVRLIGRAVRRQAPAWMIVLAVLCVLAIESFSVTTSMSAFSHHVYAKQSAEIQESADYRQAVQAARNIQRQIDSLQIDYQALPANYVTRRQQAQRQITELNEMLTSANRQIKASNNSATARTFQEVERATRLKPVHLALIAALLLSAIPAVIGLLSANLAASGAREETATGKKHKAAARLRKVA